MKSKSLLLIFIFIFKYGQPQVWNGSGVTGVAHREEEVIIGGTSGTVIGGFSKSLLQLQSDDGAAISMMTCLACSTQNNITLNAGSWGGALYFNPAGGISGSRFGIYNGTTSVSRISILANGKIGINNNTPDALFQVTDGAVLANGTTGATPVSGAGTRMMWIPEKAAFRAGKVTGSEWDNGNIGLYSSAFGLDNTVVGSYSSSFGRSNVVNAYNSVVIGIENSASGDASLIAGASNTTSGITSIALGFANIVSGDDALASGWENEVSGDYGFAVGSQNTSANAWSMTMGQDNYSDGIMSLAGGHVNVAEGDYSIVWGENSAAGGYTSIAFGNYVKSGGDYSITLGTGDVSGSSLLNNNINNSLMIGFQSTVPTFTVFPSSSTTGWGNVRIGGTGTPSNTLEITHPSSGNSGLTLKQLSGTGDANKVLTVDANGVVILVDNCCETGFQSENEYQESLEEEVDKLRKEVETLKAAMREMGWTSGENKSNNADSKCTLEQNYPNPTNGYTIIEYSIGLAFERAALQITNSQGQVIDSRTLYSGSKSIELNTENWPSGNYIYTLVIDNKPVDSKQMIVE